MSNKVDVLDEWFGPRVEKDEPRELTPALLDPALTRSYMLAGDAVLTFRNIRTAKRHTFRITKAKDRDEPHFIKVMTSSEGSKFLGTIFNRRIYRRGHKSTYSKESDQHRAFEWLWKNIDDIHPDIEVWHEGRCLRCHRRLTVPESIERGYGPECAEILGI